MIPSLWHLVWEMEPCRCVARTELQLPLPRIQLTLDAIFHLIWQKWCPASALPCFLAIMKLPLKIIVKRNFLPISSGVLSQQWKGNCFRCPQTRAATRSTLAQERWRVHTRSGFLIPPLVPSRFPVDWMVLPTFTAGSSLSAAASPGNLPWRHTHRHTQTLTLLYPQASLNPTQLTIKTNHQSF